MPKKIEITVEKLLTYLKITATSIAIVGAAAGAYRHYRRQIYKAHYEPQVERTIRRMVKEEAMRYPPPRGAK